MQERPRDPSLADPLPASPFAILGRWLDEARERRVQPNPLAMSVATASAASRPSLRLVMCRGFEPEPGYVVFYTDRESRKGAELAENPWAAATFHWDALARQVRLEGPVLPSPEEESEAWFAARPRVAQIGAWASRQSRPLGSRDELLERLREQDEHFGMPGGPPVPRPDNWGGYRLHVERCELWVGAEGRAHDRVLWQRWLEPAGQGFRAGEWSASRLQP